MSALSAAPLNWLLPLLILVAALILGPLPIVTRGLLRGFMGPQQVRNLYKSAMFGLGIGLVGTVALIAFLDSNLALNASLLCVLFLLACIDWQWRWLPFEWTVPVIVLGGIYAFQSADPVQVFIQMAVPAGALLLSRQIVLWTIKKEALGLGDLWLVAGLGAFLVPFASFLLIGFAAFSGLLEVGLRKLLGQANAMKHAVSYGTHLCIIFVIIRNFTSLA